MSKALAFLLRDLRQAASYRMQLVLALAQVAATLLLVLFIGRTFSGGVSPLLTAYRGDYFTFALVGIAVSVFVSVGLDSLARQVREAQVEGTLEAVLSTPTSIYAILLGSSLFRFLMAGIVSIGILVYGVLAAHLRMSAPAALLSLAVLALTFAAFLAVGMLSASFTMIYKQGNPIGFLFGTSSYFLGGVLFPVSALPRPLQAAAQVLPTTHAVAALRDLLLSGAPPSAVLPLVARLLVFIAAVAPLAIVAFGRAVRRARRDGTLVQY